MLKALGLVILALLMVGCGGTHDPDPYVDETGQSGWTDIGRDAAYRCIGSTLVIDGYATLAVVPNHSECGGDLDGEILP